MRSVRGVAAAVAAAFNIAAGCAAAETVQTVRDEPRLLLFSTTDLWRHGGFGHGGVVWSPGGVDNECLSLKLMFGGGVYRYTSGALGNAEVIGRQFAAAIMPGWRFRCGTLIATIFAGLDLQNHRLTPDDPSAGLRGSYAGLRVGFEVWYEPTPATMLATDASVSTIGSSYTARAAYGWRVFDRFYLGPEMHGFAAGDNYRQFRTGFHVTGFKMETFEWSIGAGWATDSDDRDGAYGKLGLLLRR